MLIEPDGDAVLLVRDESCEQQIRLRVKTPLLREASPVFDIMFGHKFAEGQALDKYAPPEIPLEDDPECMKLICQVVHFQTSNLPRHLPASQVLQLARTVDKYGLLEAMDLAFDRWLMPSKDIHDLHLFMRAAMLLKHEAGFQSVTRELLHVMVSKAPFVAEGRNFGLRDEDLPILCMYSLARGCQYADVEDTLEQRRADLRVEVNQFIFQEALSIAGSCQCGWAARFASNSMENAQSNGLDPKGVADMSIAKVIERLESMGDPIVPSPGEDGGCQNKRWHTAPKFIRYSRRLALECLREVGGLRLDCWEEAMQDENKHGVIE